MERIDLEKGAKALFKTGCVQFGDYTLKDGTFSSVYIDLRRLRSFPEEKSEIVGIYQKFILDKQLKFDLMADIPTATTPLVSSLSDRINVPQITPRLDFKGYGNNAKIDGVFEKGQVVLPIDDVLSSGKTKLQAIDIFRSNQLLVNDLVVLIDREQGGEAELEKIGVKTHFVYGLQGLLLDGKNLGFLSDGQYLAASVGLWNSSTSFNMSKVGCFG